MSEFLTLPRAVIEQALEALECCTPKSQYYSNQQLGDAITSLRAALEQPQSEKFIWYVQVNDYESSWPVGFYDSEEKATAACEDYQLDAKNFEQAKRVVKAEVK